MSNRLRWYIIGNLIGIVLLVGGIILINHYRSDQELPQTTSTPQASKAPTVQVESSAGATPKSP